MPAFLIPILGWVRGNRILSGIIGLLVLVLILFAIVKAIERHGADKAIEKRDRADAHALAADAQRNAIASGRVSTEAATDAATVAAQTEELTNAIVQGPDTVAGADAIRFGCGVLRQQGRNIKAYPACVAAGF